MTDREDSSRLIAGVMTGTSVDALDAALVQVRGRGLGMRCSVLRSASRPLDELADPLRAFANGAALTAHDLTSVAYEFALAHVRTLSELLGDQSCDLICIHGQTVYHRPPLSWQLLNPAPIAAAFESPVVWDLRSADLAAGGQGAPITPVADYILFRAASERRAVINCGGFLNTTILSAAGDTDPEANNGDDIDHGELVERIGARDVCVCNQLLDQIARERFDEPYDVGGHRAAKGVVNDDAFRALESMLASQASAPRSLGSGDELREWVREWQGRIKGEDQAATACAAIGATAAKAVRDVADRVLIAGGGVKNSALVKSLRARLSAPVEPTDAHGVNADDREAVAMAILGALCQDRVSITLPQVTGVRRPAPIAGAWMYAP